jgi:hypothetical protein
LLSTTASTGGGISTGVFTEPFNAASRCFLRPVTHRTRYDSTGA